MPTARELLEQADALMRRNRANALDDIPVLTEAMPAVAFTPAPRKSPVDPGPPSVPLLTDNVDVIDEDEPLGVAAVEGEPSVWLEFEDENPSVIGDAPDSIAIVPPVEMRSAPPDEALLASAEHEEIEFTLPAEETPAGQVADDLAGLDATDAVEDETEEVVEDGAEDVLAPDAAGTFEAATASAIEADAGSAVGADFDAVEDADAGAAEGAGFEAAADAADVVDVADDSDVVDVVDVADVSAVVDEAPAGEAVHEAYAALPVEAPPTVVTTAPVPPDSALPPLAPPSPVLPAPPFVPAGLVALAASAPAVAAAAAEAPVAAPAAPSMADDDERWAAAAEEIRMQVLQRIDLFTDTGLRDQLTQRLQPIADRASADFVKAINLHVGDLLRTYVAEAIEREIERWRRDH